MEDKEKIICNISAQALILLDFLDNNEEYHDIHNKKLKDYYIYFLFVISVKNEYLYYIIL